MQFIRIRNLVFFVGAALVAQNAHATVTVLDFELVPGVVPATLFADQTPLTTQYASVGVTISGALVELTTGTFLAAQSGVNVAYAPSGMMVFTFDPVLAANVQSVSAYVTGGVGVGIYAYDSLNNLIGTSFIPAGAGANTLLTVTSTTNAIATVQIHDGGSQFLVDDFSFVTAAPCTSQAGSLKTTTSALVKSDFVKPTHASSQRHELSDDASDIAVMIARKAAPAKVIAELNSLLAQVQSWLMAGANKTKLINLINQLIAAERAAHC